jgi:hypothetical protein
VNGVREPLLIAQACLGQCCVCRDGDEAVQRRIELLYPGQAELREFFGGDHVALQGSGGLRQDPVFRGRAQGQRRAAEQPRRSC